MKWIIDAGHGGIDQQGQYTTAPRKMYVHPDFTIYEGVVNRRIAERLCTMLRKAEIQYFKIYHPFIDISLRGRIDEANRLHRKHGNTALLSIHSNAGGGKGIEIWTSKGQTKSDVYADVFYKVFEESGRFPMRSDFYTDGDSDKEADFAILAKTRMPAVLPECLFFDNYEEAKFLMTDEGVQYFAECLFKGIMKIENGEL